MLFPCGFGVFPKSQPRPQDFGRSYNPYGSFGKEVPKTLVRSALPSAVILDGVLWQPRPFHLLDSRPFENQETPAKTAPFSSAVFFPNGGFTVRGGILPPPRRTKPTQGDMVAYRGYICLVSASVSTWFIRSAPPERRHPQQRQKKASISWAWVRWSRHRTSSQ